MTQPGMNRVLITRAPVSVWIKSRPRIKHDVQDAMGKRFD